MSNWVNRHVGEIVLAGFGVFGAAAIGFAYNVGQNSSELAQIKDTQSGLIEEIGNLKVLIGDRFDGLEQRIDINQSDLKSILVATKTVAEGDVYYAALIKEEVWVFPDPSLDAKMVKNGYELEKVTKFLSGYKVMPYAPQ